MASISDIVLRDIESISQAYALNITEPSRILQHLAQDIRDEGDLIQTFDRIDPITDRSLVAVDGGNASEQLAGGDLIVAGATIGEGLHSKTLYENPDDYPTEVFSSIVPHTSSNDRLEKSIRAALELRVLQSTPSDLKIIDGAYVGNVSAVLYALLDREPAVSNGLLELNWFDTDGLLKDSMANLLYPSRKNTSNIIAVPKSDSSRVYANKLLNAYKVQLNLTDRILASKLLKPGEFFTPRNIDSNPALISTLTKNLKLPDFADKSSNRKMLITMLQDKAGLLTRLGLAPTEEGLLWTTYFKPTAWSEYSKVIKIEFVFYANETKQTPIERARELIQIIDQDIVDEAVLEPWAQYMADRGAKGVSDAINIVKNYLLSSVESASELSGLIRGYRT